MHFVSPSSIPSIETYMIPSVVKEASGLYTIKSTLYMQPTKADKDSVFQCTVEYSMPGDQIKQKTSDSITINLNCEWRGGTRVLISDLYRSRLAISPRFQSLC